MSLEAIIVTQKCGHRTRVDGAAFGSLQAAMKEAKRLEGERCLICLDAEGALASGEEKKESAGAKAKRTRLAHARERARIIRDAAFLIEELERDMQARPGAYLHADTTLIRRLAFHGLALREIATEVAPKGVEEGEEEQSDGK